MRKLSEPSRRAPVEVYARSVTQSGGCVDGILKIDAEKLRLRIARHGRCLGGGCVDLIEAHRVVDRRAKPIQLVVAVVERHALRIARGDACESYLCQRAGGGVKAIQLALHIEGIPLAVAVEAQALPSL